MQDLLDRLQKARPLLAGYVSAARSTRMKDDTVIWVFDDPHLARPLIDAQNAIEQIAADVYGRPVKVRIESGGQAAPSGRRTEDQPSPLREDPVVKAFAKHLGGEIVDSRKR